jgi:hypothetical protein
VDQLPKVNVTSLSSAFSGFSFKFNFKYASLNAPDFSVDNFLKVI